MTNADLTRIESELKVRLPAAYRRLVSQPPFDDRLYSTADRVIRATLEDRRDYGRRWRKSYLTIGRDFTGNSFFLVTAGANPDEVRFADHEQPGSLGEGSLGPLADFPAYLSGEPPVQSPQPLPTPADPASWAQGKQLYQAGDLPQARLCFDQVVQAAPKCQPDFLAEPWEWHEWALCLARLFGAFGLALPFMERAVELAPERPDGWVDLGICRLKNGRAETALEALDKALALRPLDPRACLWRAQTLLLTDRLQEARTALPDGPDTPQLLSLKGRILGRLGLYAQCLEAWQSALALSPNDPELAAALAQARRDQLGHFMQTQDWSEAEPLARQLEEAHLLAQVLWGMQRHSEALAEWRKALEADPFALESWRALAQAHRQLGDPYQAARTYHFGIQKGLAAEEELQACLQEHQRNLGQDCEPPARGEQPRWVDDHFEEWRGSWTTTSTLRAIHAHEVMILETRRRPHAPPPGPDDAPPRNLPSADISLSAGSIFWVPNLSPGPLPRPQLEKFGGHPVGLPAARRPRCPACRQLMPLHYQGSKLSALAPAGSTVYLFGCCGQGEIVVAKPGQSKKLADGPHLPELVVTAWYRLQAQAFPGTRFGPLPRPTDWPPDWHCRAHIAPVQFLWENHPGPDHGFSAPGAQGMYTRDWLPRPAYLAQTPTGPRYLV